jgi:hypothetical protein
MKRALIVAVTTGVFFAPIGIPHQVISAAPTVADTPTAALPENSTTEDTSDSSGCALPTGSALAAAGGCCQQRGGICGCRNGTPKCCDGTIGADCSCRADTAAPQTEHSVAE